MQDIFLSQLHYLYMVIPHAAFLAQIRNTRDTCIYLSQKYSPLLLKDTDYDGNG